MTTTDQRATQRATQVTLDDPARGRRRLWRDAAGHTVGIEMADGTELIVHRDEDAGYLGVVTGEGTPLIELTTPVTIPAALRAFGLSPSQAAQVDRTHRLEVTDATGIATRTELCERSIRIERESAVLRIDADDDGRPRRVSAPGFDDLVCAWADGRWQLVAERPHAAHRHRIARSNPVRRRPRRRSITLLERNRPRLSSAVDRPR